MIRRVSGPSMSPTLSHGQIVLFLKRKRIRVGDVVLCHVDGMDNVKRVTRIRPGEIWVEGDNRAGSTDSRDFGWITSRSIVAKMLLTFPK